MLFPNLLKTCEHYVQVRNSAIHTLFQSLGSHGQKISKSMWEDCLRNYVFPILDCVSHLAVTSSRDEWQGKELGTRGGKAAHMLIHYRINMRENLPMSLNEQN